MFYFKYLAVCLLGIIASLVVGKPLSFDLAYRPSYDPYAFDYLEFGKRSGNPCFIGAGLDVGCEFSDLFDAKILKQKFASPYGPGK
uniref:Secreted protein n=1 Tax=Panagrellus redivivus TaxID=6233 RepID=A0A7E4ZVQ1_PANRE